MTTPTGLPPLSLSGGPSQASGSSGGTNTTGDFYYRSDDWTTRLMPFAVLGVAAWLIWKR